jgi:uncharacterized membrane protein
MDASWTLSPRVAAIIAVMTAAALLCRYVGFWFMRLIPITPRVEAGLKAIPLAVMIGIILPPVLRGGVPESVALALTIVSVRLGANDLIAVIVGMGSVALLRGVL